MLALSRLLSTGILVFLVAFFVWLYALMKTSKQADQMSQRWIERERHRRFAELLVSNNERQKRDQRWLESKWLEEHRGEVP
jgi:hypothetical protein